MKSFPFCRLRTAFSRWPGYRFAPNRSSPLSAALEGSHICLPYLEATTIEWLEVACELLLLAIMGRGVARGREQWLVGCWALWRVADGAAPAVRWWRRTGWATTGMSGQRRSSLVTDDGRRRRSGEIGDMAGSGGAIYHGKNPWICWQGRSMGAVREGRALDGMSCIRSVGAGFVVGDEAASWIGLWPWASMGWAMVAGADRDRLAVGWREASLARRRAMGAGHHGRCRTTSARSCGRSWRG
ncbi:hypothetical protein ACLOJK_006787 [Asimina triloba]